ncbi:MAG: sensor histidine kinase/response regulator, partial [Phenylobacterium sp.]|nr:sensor histidine kinase/response regulator [Phenylobacterium sp.]
AAQSELFQWSVDCSSDALAVLDTDLRFLVANDAWRREFKVCEGVVGQSAEPLFDGLPAADLLQACLKQTENLGEVRHVECAGGNLLIQTWRTRAGELGGLTLRHSAHRTEAQPQPPRLAGRLRLAMKMAKVVAFEIDYRTGAGIYDPPGAGPSGLVLRNFEDTLQILPPSARDEARTLWERHLLTGEMFVLEYEWPRPDGEMAWHMNACEAIKDRCGEVIGLIGMRQDISDRRHAELAIIAEREAAKAADNAKSSFLANMSHEIRTPLNGVLAMTQVLALEELKPGQREKLDVIRQSGEDLLHILNDILDFSKIEAGKLELENIEFDPCQVLDSALASFAAVAERKSLSLRLEISPDAKGIRRGDPSRLRQIANNYISNALKFTPEGEVCISMSGVGKRGREGLTLSVRDSGEGISLEKMQLLFQKFSQLDVSTTRQFGGTGLGLAICQELAVLMGGSVWAESEPGRGSTFYATLPLPYVGEPSQSQPSQIQIEGVGTDRVLRVLAAEDNPTNQIVLTTIMKVMGLELSLVGDGRAAVDAWRRGEFDVILMDIQMPEMDGVTATRLIRAAEAHDNLDRIPIIALSANAFSHQINEYLAAGMDGHVAKPIELSALYAALEGVLGAAEPERVAV